MVNKVILLGRVGKDAEVRYSGNGSPVANFSLATDESYKNNSGERVQKTEWHKIVVFGSRAEICGQYVKKGKLIYIEGKIQTRSWEDADDVKRQTTEIVVQNLKLLDTKGKNKSDNSAANDDDIPF